MRNRSLMPSPWLLAPYTHLSGNVCRGFGDASQVPASTSNLMMSKAMHFDAGLVAPPIPAGLNLPSFVPSLATRSFTFNKGMSPSQMLAARDAVVARLQVYPDYRVLDADEARAAVDDALERLSPKRSGIDAFLAKAKSDDPVPEDLLLEMPREDLQRLILAYVYFGSAGSQMYENGLADAMLSNGTWSQDFIDGDLESRSAIFDMMGKWDVDGIYERAFAPISPYSGAGLGNPFIIAGVVVACFAIAAVAYYFIQTTNFAKECETRHKYQMDLCKQAGSNETLQKACVEFGKPPPSVGESNATALRDVGIAAVFILSLYAFATFGAPHLVDWWERRHLR